MPLIKISEVVIKPNRQRIEFEAQAMQDLADSIEVNGLFHPPVLRREGDAFVLVAGERRLRAMEQLHTLGTHFLHGQQSVPEGFIPYTDIGMLTDLQAEEAELDENIKRRDLTWQEHAAALDRLHTLRQKQKDVVYEAAIAKGEDPGLQVQTIANTAEEVYGRSDGYYGDQVRKKIIVAKHLDNPVIAKAKSAEDAFKLLKKQEEADKFRELAAKQGKVQKTSDHIVRNVDCLQFLRLPENVEAYDVILTDPPYGMGANRFGDAGGKLGGIEHHYDDSYRSWLTLMTAWTQLSYQVAKPQAHAYVFCDIDNFFALRELMQKAGWYTFRTPLIVHKLNSGRVPLPDRGPRRQYEIILYALKGDRPVTHIYPDVIPCTADENMTHGAQKPVELFQNLLQRSVRPGDTVLDTFGGTGTIIPAAHALLCKATVCELNPEYYGMCLKRIEDLEKQQTLI